MLRRLVKAGQLPPLTATMEWTVPGEESVPRPPKGYVVSFMAPRAQLLRPRRAVHPGISLRVQPLAVAPQPKQHLADGVIRGDVRGVLWDKCPLAAL
jgi:hypothetical protein